MGYLIKLTKTLNLNFIKAFLALSLVISGLFLSKSFLVVKNGEIVSTIAYYVIFLPYIILAIIIAILLVIKKLKIATPLEKKTLFFHLLGGIILGLGGLADLIVTITDTDEIMPIKSFTIIGVMGFGIMATLIFVERFLMLIQDRQIAYDKLETAYKDIEEANTLKELGQSTAIINHEIKNYMMIISGYADFIRATEPLTERGKKAAQGIMNGVNKMTEFSHDILEYSKAKILTNKKEINLTEVVNKCLNDVYPKLKEKFILVGFDKKHFIHGDWNKLEHVFVNLFNNSFEADAKQIKVTISESGGTILLLSIEDDGAGCSEEQMESLFKAFYTTKADKKGNGLGMSLTRAIIESHGGHISAYSRNLAGDNQHGLTLVITFPIFHTTDKKMPEDAYRNNIVLIKENIENLAGVIRIFQNVHIAPKIMQNIDDLKMDKNINDDAFIIANAKNIEQIKDKTNRFKKLTIISSNKHHLYALDISTEVSTPQIFSEEYILKHFMAAIDN
ncbi:MAG: HAMP domain-containing sensor histidine kinase [Chitinivibrionales bacterium]|nr:HAMP domain-containing sensor histidine kinase [Chitinivibrionales bacterium]